MLPQMIDSSPHDTLNSPQRRAIETTEGAVLILAGAGTGKTRVLTTRLAHLIDKGLAYPNQILAVTFTNKAATEMKERVAALMGKSIEGFWLGTFHSLAVRILRRHADLVGLTSEFTILDADDQQRLVKQIIQAQGLDEKKNPSKMGTALINRWKDRGLLPDGVSWTEGLKNKTILGIYKEYQARLRIVNAADFGDLLLHNLTIFQKNPEILQAYQKQFNYILVDEYQDTNVAQYLWLRLLAAGSGNICCVGDDDQSIYAWRGAEVGNILRFEQDFPGAAVIPLEQNYRSTPHILGAASGLIKKNSGRFDKTLWTDVNQGEKVVIRGTYDSLQEAQFVGDEIEKHRRRGHLLSQMAILVRAGYQTREFEDRLLVLGIPYRVIGGQKFYERMEVRDALAYLRLIAQPQDGFAFERIVNTPRRGIGASTLQLIHCESRAAGLSLVETTKNLLDEEKIKGGAKNSLRQFMGQLDTWRDQLSKNEPGAFTKLVLDESGYTEMWQQDKSPDAPGRLENLKELVNAIKEFDTIPAFLEHVSLVMDTTSMVNTDMVNLMTLHMAKGLEFDVVFLPGWEESIFPNARALDENGVEGLEEERRLAYVGITRARQEAIITYAHNRKTFQGWQYATPSRFIGELPKEHSRHIQASGAEALNGTKTASGRSRSWGRSDVSTADFVVDPSPNHPFQKGDYVFHRRFGYGVVQETERDNIKVDFESTAGTKTVVADYLEKA
jgi:DNA helicase II / ATP-dependent DNA helicase PcrA